MNAVRIHLRQPIDVDGRRVTSLRVRWPAPHLIDDALDLPDDPALRVAATVALLTGLNAPAAYSVADEDARAILDAATALLRRATGARVQAALVS